MNSRLTLLFLLTTLIGVAKCRHSSAYVPTSFTCSWGNPCNPLRVSNLYYYPYAYSASYYIQCSQSGQCFEQPCPSGTVWSQGQLTCIASGSAVSTNYCAGVNCNNGWCGRGLWV